MSDTPELDDLKAIAKAAVAVGEALQRTRDQLNESSDPVDEAGAAGCRDLISHLAGDIRAATRAPLEIVEKRLPNAVLIVIHKKT